MEEGEREMLTAELAVSIAVNIIVLAFFAGKRMQLIRENQNGLPLLQCIYMPVHRYIHLALRYTDALKRTMQMHRKIKILAIFLTKVFRNTEMLKLIKHTSLQRTNFVYLLYNF